MSMTWRVCRVLPMKLGGTQHSVWRGVYPDGLPDENHVIGSRYEPDVELRDPYGWWKEPLCEVNPWEVPMGQSRGEFVLSLLDMGKDSGYVRIGHAELPAFMEKVANVLGAIATMPGLGNVARHEGGGPGTGQMRVVFCEYPEERNVADLKQILAMAEAAHERGYAIDCV